VDGKEETALSLGGEGGLVSAFDILFAFIGVFSDRFVIGQFGGESGKENRLGGIEGQRDVFAFLLRCVFQCFYKFFQHVMSQMSASPMEYKGKVFTDWHLSSFTDIFDFGEREFVFSIIGAVAAGTGGNRIDDRFMVPEQASVIQIKVVISDDSVMAQRVIKGGIQMEVLTVQFQNIPGVAILNAFFGICL
jgi:hypothetical protein